MQPFIMNANFCFSILLIDRLNTSETGALWIPFQTAAGTVTTLYKGEFERMLIDVGSKCLFIYQFVCLLYLFYFSNFLTHRIM